MPGQGSSSSCGACKFLRRKCTSECVFAPYFSYDEAATHFGAVHKVFGASNVSKLLMHIPVQHRTEAALTISYEAFSRMTDPVFGCVAHIYALHQQIANLQEEIELVGSQMAAGFPFTFPVSQPTADKVSMNPAAFNLQQQMDHHQQAQYITNAGYGNSAADQSYIYQCQQLPFVWGSGEAHSGNIDNYLNGEINEGLDHEPLLCSPLLNNNDNVTEIPNTAASGW
uniref:LOB domain-containing protein n=1 Tax=Kalanchoe fedtschenkoi TaxID=63787 RepID=A0A7N0V479_KALFE